MIYIITCFLIFETFHQPVGFKSTTEIKQTTFVNKSAMINYYDSLSNFENVVRCIYGDCSYAIDIKIDSCDIWCDECRGLKIDAMTDIILSNIGVR